MRAWAVVENGAPLKEIELPTPEPKGTEVLLEVTHCGVCHSDLHIWEGYYDIGGGKKMSLKDRGVTLPLAMGHEIVGRVVKLGPDATGREGRRSPHRLPVARLRHVREVPRRRGQHVRSRRAASASIQNGGYGTHVIAPHPRHLVDPGNARSGGRGDLCLLRHHRLFGDQEGDAAAAARADRAGRRRRPGPERHRRAEGAEAPEHHRRSTSARRSATRR